MQYKVSSHVKVTPVGIMQTSSALINNLFSIWSFESSAPVTPHWQTHSNLHIVIDFWENFIYIIIQELKTPNCVTMFYTTNGGKNIE